MGSGGLKLAQEIRIACGSRFGLNPGNMTPEEDSCGGTFDIRQNTIPKQNAGGRRVGIETCSTAATEAEGHETCTLPGSGDGENIMEGCSG